MRSPPPEGEGAAETACGELTTTPIPCPPAPLGGRRERKSGVKFSPGRRIIECFGLEGTVRGHLAQPPCSKPGHLQLDQAAKSPVQRGLECFQGWGLVVVFPQFATKNHTVTLSLLPPPWWGGEENQKEKGKNLWIGRRTV